MKIRFERGGGITATIDVDSLPAAQAQEIERLLASAEFFDLPPELDPLVSVPGDYRYTITVQDSARHHTVKVQGAEAPEAVQTLLDRLDALARAH